MGSRWYCANVRYTNLLTYVHHYEKQTFHYLLDLHAKCVNFSYRRSVRVVITATDAMYRQLSLTVYSGHIVVLEIYHLVCVLNNCTDQTTKQYNIGSASTNSLTAQTFCHANGQWTFPVYDANLWNDLPLDITSSLPLAQSSDSVSTLFCSISHIWAYSFDTHIYVVLEITHIIYQWWR